MMDFDFTFAEGTTWDQMVAFEMAGEVWSEYLSDNMTVNIHVEMTNDLPDNVIGGALPAMLTDINYGVFRDVYEADVSSWGDETAFLGLPLTNDNGLEQFEARINLGAEAYVVDSSNLDLTRANAKALGLVNSNSTELDGYIMMSDLSGSSTHWSNNVYQTDNNQLDFFSVAIHEVGHILGFVSGVDKSEGLFFNNVDELQNYFDNDANLINEYLDSAIDRASPMDLFRYSTESQTLDNSSNTIDLSMGSDSFFSINGKRRWSFAKGKNEDLGGDGYQASHWQTRHNQDQFQGIMDPVLRTGMQRTVSNRDLVVMDNIGYDITDNAFDLLRQPSKDNNWVALNRSNDFIDSIRARVVSKIAENEYGETIIQDLDISSLQNRFLSSHAFSDRTNDVQQMIEQSQVYQARRGRSNYANWQEAYFSEFSWQELSESAPESAGINYVVNTEFYTNVDFQTQEENSELDGDFVSDFTYTIEQTELQLLNNPQQDRAEDSEVDFSLLRSLTNETMFSLL